MSGSADRLPRLTRRAVLGGLVVVGAGAAVGCGTPPGPPGRTPTPAASGSPTASRSPTATGTPGAATPSSTGPSAPNSASSGSPAPSRSTTDCVHQLSLEQRVGQLLMMGVNSGGATGDQLDILGQTHAGAVIMMGNTSLAMSGIARVTDQMRQSADRAAGIDLLVATDQEGGLVQRLTGPGFDTIPSARTQCTWSTGTLRTRAERWGRQLADAGVNSPLAPVADVVPASIGRANKPIAANNRGYGSDPDEVAERIVAVVEGFRAGGVATALKHFPGLGRVIGNTDFATKVVDDTTTATDPLLQPFVAGMKAGTDMVMVSTALYTKIDPDHIAAFSDTVITTVLRGRYGWDGVVISDDLGVAKAVSGVSPGDRAVRFLRAGGDIVLNVDPATVRAMADAVVAEAQRDSGFAADIATKAARVLHMKRDRGLAQCTA